MSFCRFKKCEVIKNSAIKFGIAGKNSYLLDFYLSISGLNQSSFKVPTAGDLLHLEILNKKSKFLVFGYTRNITPIHTLNKGDRRMCTFINIFTFAISRFDKGIKGEQN